MLTEIMLFLGRLGLLLLLFINLVYVFFPPSAISTEKRTEQLLEHWVLAIAGGIGLAVLQLV